MRASVVVAHGLSSCGSQTLELRLNSCGERGLFFIAMRGLLIAVASLVEEHGL